MIASPGNGLRAWEFSRNGINRIVSTTFLYKIGEYTVSDLQEYLSVSKHSRGASCTVVQSLIVFYLLVSIHPR